MFEKGSVSFYFLVVACTAIVLWILLTVNHYVFKKIQKKSNKLHILLFKRIISVIIVFACIVVGLSFLGDIDSLWKSVLGGTAVISAVLVFAAQDIIKDILAGLMISVYKPFEIGSRIELEGGMSGVVKDITLRHTVIHTWGSREMIIPNSRLNNLILLNDSYNTHIRSYQASFNIGYGSDVTLAMSVIKKAIMDSEYTIEGKDTPRGKVYDDVYFMAYEASSLRMETTIYYKNTPTEIVKSDINTRVNIALNENNIEIPYSYINVIQK